MTRRPKRDNIQNAMLIKLKYGEKKTGQLSAILVSFQRKNVMNWKRDVSYIDVNLLTLILFRNLYRRTTKLYLRGSEDYGRSFLVKNK